MRRFNSSLLACGFVLLPMLSGCSKPTDAVIPSDMATWDKELAPHVQKLSEEQRKQLAGYLMRAKLGEVFGGKGVAPGTTIGQALAEQKDWQASQAKKEAEEQALKAKLDSERKQALEALAKAVTVTLLGKRELPKSYDAGRYSEYQEFSIGVQNNADKDLAGVSGEIKFIDIFDKEVGAVNFRISEKVAPGKSVVWRGGRDYNQFVDKHRAVWNLEEGKYKTRFVPEMLVYADGSKLVVPSAPD